MGSELFALGIRQQNLAWRLNASDDYQSSFSEHRKLDRYGLRLLQCSGKRPAVNGLDLLLGPAGDRREFQFLAERRRWPVGAGQRLDGQLDESLAKPQLRRSAQSE